MSILHIYYIFRWYTVLVEMGATNRREREEYLLLEHPKERKL